MAIVGLDSGLLLRRSEPKGRRQLHAKYVAGRAGNVPEGWQIFLEILEKVCGAFETLLFQAVWAEV